MLKRSITFEDFDGNQVTEVHFFNLSKSELLELETEEAGGLSAALQRIVDSQNVGALIKEFKKLVLLAYGQRSEDGKRFVKNDQLREEFSQSLAYDALFMELVSNDRAAIEFINGIVPKDLAAQIEAQNKELVAAATESIKNPSGELVLPPPPPAV